MRNGMRGLGALIGVILFTSAESSAAVITGVTVEEVSSELSDFGRLAVDAVNGSGITTVLDVSSHDSNPGNMWLTTGDGDLQPADPHVADNTGQLAHIVFDLGATTEVSSFRVWNYNEAPNGGNVFNTRGAQNVEISVSDSAGGAFTPVTDPGDSNTTFTFLIAPGTDAYLGELFTFATPFTGRYVRFDIISNYGDTNLYTGLSEVQFDDAVIPEPSGLALLGLAAGATLLRRRRSAC